MINHEITIPFSTDKYEKRVIIFIDLIGFKEYVLINNGGGKEDVIKDLTSYFQRQVSEGAKHIKGKSHSYTPSFNFFSDTIIISYPLELFNSPDELKKLKLEEFPNFDFDRKRLLMSVFFSACDIQLYALKFGMLTRGCITIGDIYHNKNTWFGPGIIEAHELESKIAIFPRVILSKSAFEYFKSEVLSDQSSSWMQDADGYFYLNYFSWINNKLGDDISSAHHKLREIIISNINRLRNKQKYKELQKWQWLGMYFNKFNDKGRERGSPDSENYSKNIDIDLIYAY